MRRGEVAELVKTGPLAVESADHPDLILARKVVKAGGQAGHADIDRAGDDRLGNRRACTEIDELGFETHLSEVPVREADIDRPGGPDLEHADLDCRGLRTRGRNRDGQRSNKREPAK